MIALTMIALGLGDEPRKMGRAMASAMPYVDAAFITLTGPKDQMGEAEKVLKEVEDTFKKPVMISYEHDQSIWTVNEEQVKWLTEFFGWEPVSKVGDEIFQFDVARNYNMSQVNKEFEWILWLDCDDILRGGEKIQDVLAQANKEGIEALYFNYIYQAVIKDNKIEGVIIEHLRERIIKNDGAYKWIAPIHETLIEQRPTRKKDYQEIDVLHLAEDEKRVKSLDRNIRALEYTIFQNKGTDPRPVYYYGKALYDLNTRENDKRASGLMYYYLNDPQHKSGWPEERAQACEYLCEIYKRNGENDKAILSCFEAMREDLSPTSFLNVASTYVLKGDYEKALAWLKIAMAVEGKKTTLVVNPREIQAKTLEILFNAHMNLNHVDEAWAAAVKMVEAFPDNESALKGLQFMEQLRQQRDMTKHIVELANYLKQTGEGAKIKPLLAAVPSIAENTPFTAELRKKNLPPKYWGDNEVVVYCGPGFTNWSPKGLQDPKGSFVGGSEEAVILMCKELAKLGYKVTVYNDPGADEGEYDGVTYLPYYKFNSEDHFNIVISWRQPEFVDQVNHFKRMYIWCHDILNSLQFTKERVDKVTKIIVLSPWHRQNLPEVPDEKILISSNGIA